MSYRDISLSQLRSFEGQVLYLYRDTAAAGNATLATGKLLANVTVALTVPFRSATDLPATPDQIRADYARVMAIPRGLDSKRYYSSQGLFITQVWADAQLAYDQAGCEDELRTIFHGYDALPDPVKIVLIDMIFNLGGGGFRDYHKMIASIHAGDFMAAAGESYRNGISVERNKWAHDQLELAGTADQ
jgi:GH24 family phage-related lysozyme (muramidase)